MKFRNKPHSGKVSGNLVTKHGVSTIDLVFQI